YRRARLPLAGRRHRRPYRPARPRQERRRPCRRGTEQGCRRPRAPAPARRRAQDGRPGHEAVLRPMDLVVMAAGLGTRFGGLKQLAPVGRNGEAIVDYAGAWAQAAGFERAVVIVRSEIEETIGDHLEKRWPASFPHVLVCQDREKRVQDIRREKPLGTAHAVVTVAEHVDGPFAVVNADDLYAADSYGLLARHLTAATGSHHALVAFEVAKTLIGPRPVTRAL